MNEEKEKDVILEYVQTKELKRVIFTGTISEQSTYTLHDYSILKIQSNDLIREDLFNWQDGLGKLKITIEKAYRIAEIERNECEYRDKLSECRTCLDGTNNGKRCNRYKIMKATEIAEELEEYFTHAPGAPADFQVVRRYGTEIRRILKGV